MIDRKKKLKFIQFFLLFIGLIIIYFTYYHKAKDVEDGIISKTAKDKANKKINKNSLNDNDVFYNIEYTGLDLHGNRYVLKSEEAQLSKLKSEIIYMKIVNAVFYFKDNTTLYVWADEGIYNNKTFDMKFNKNVKAEYLESKLYAGKADYSNSENYLSIYENVRINDTKGNLIADKLLFDITKQKLDITSFNNGKINANVKLN